MSIADKKVSTKDSENGDLRIAVGEFEKYRIWMAGVWVPGFKLFSVGKLW